jgi:hypothetical protein
VKLRWPRLPTPEERLARAAAREVRKAQNVLLNWIAPDSTEEGKDYYRIGDKWTRSLLVFDKPGKAAAGWDGWLSSLLLIDGGPDAHGTVRLSITWAPYTPFGAGVKLGLAETGHQATVALMRGRGQVPGRDLLRSIRDVDRVQENLSDANTRLLAVGVIVTCEAPTREGCESVWREVTGRLSARLLHWRPLDDRQAEAFQMQTPGGDRPIWHPLSWDTGTLAFSWPCIGSTVDMGTGPIWGYESKTRRPIQYDPFNAAAGGPPAPHVCIIGPTGNGKSVAFFTVAVDYLTEPDAPYLRIIDPKGDYLVACRKLDGTLIRLAADAREAINVFDLAPVAWTHVEGHGPQPERNVVYEAVENVIGAVRLMCAAANEGFSAMMASVLETAVLRAYETVCGAVPDAPPTWDVPSSEVPTLVDLHETLTAMGYEVEAPETAKTLAVLLKPYALGRYSGLFARHTTADLANPVIVYDIRGIPEGLRPVAIHLITTHTWREARRTRRRWIFAMDEVTQLLRFPESARAVADVYLQGRFVGLSAWSMGQSIFDYLQTHEGRQAIDMADTVLLLRQKAEESLREACSRFRLHAGHASYLAAAGLGQGVLWTSGRGAVALHIVPPPIVFEWLPKGHGTTAKEIPELTGQTA